MFSTALIPWALAACANMYLPEVCVCVCGGDGVWGRVVRVVMVGGGMVYG